MADEIQVFNITVPAGTPQAAPLTFALTMPPRLVESIEILVPPGPRGEVGFQVAAAGNQIIPPNPGVYLITDNETINWPLAGQIQSGAWQVIAYNTGSFPHTLYFRFLVNLPPSPGAAGGGQPLAMDALSSG